MPSLILLRAFTYITVVFDLFVLLLLLFVCSLVFKMQCVRECAGKWFMFSQENDFPDNLESLVSLFGPLQPKVGGK